MKKRICNSKRVIYRDTPNVFRWNADSNGKKSADIAHVKRVIYRHTLNVFRTGTRETCERLTLTGKDYARARSRPCSCAANAYRLNGRSLPAQGKISAYRKWNIERNEL